MIPQQIEVLEDGIIFKFIEKISGKRFDNATDWGFTIQDKDNDMKHPRWGIVERIGPKVKHCVVGQYVLIENLQWTNALEYDGDKFWKTNESRVIMTSEKEPITV